MEKELSDEEKKATCEALDYYLNRWPNEENRADMVSARVKLGPIGKRHRDNK
jgi:hypothetical protein